jgi:hypothetical protein
MEPVYEDRRLIKRQTELANAMRRRPGGIRVTEERELFPLRHATHSIFRRRNRDH